MKWLKDTLSTFVEVRVKPYSGSSRRRGGLDGTQSSTKESCSCEREVYNRGHSKEGGVEGMMNMCSGGDDSDAEGETVSGAAECGKGMDKYVFLADR